MLDVVLARRRGLPILLATVMIEVGRRVGVPVVGIGMPMHFLVRGAGDPDALRRPVHRRRASTAPVPGAGSRRMTGGRVPWDDRHLAPTRLRG